MLFYLDPPYHGNETDYGKGMFGRGDFTAIADRLHRLKGRFVMSINDVPEIRKTLVGFDLQTATLNYTVNGGKGVPAKELIVSGPQRRFTGSSKRL